MTSLTPAWLIDAVRTPFGKNRGALSGIRTDDLGAVPIRELLSRHPSLDPASIEDVHYGNTNGAGEENRNVGRMAALLAGLPDTVPGVTVNRLCASGGEAFVQAAQAVSVGNGDLHIAGGVEGMSRAPYVLPKPDEGLPRSMELHQTTVGWRLVNPAFPDAWTRSLGACAQSVAEELGIDREAMDAYAARSHGRVAAAYDRGCHDGFVAPLAGLERDESLRVGTTAEGLAKLPSAFSKDGSVTAGNASPINDGALAAFIGTAEAVERLGVQPLGRIVASAAVGVAPDRFAIAPVPAIEKLLARTGVEASEIALWEINEAFAAVVLACVAQAPWLPQELLNVNGGAIAIGHPLGASAPRVVVDLCRELRRRGGGYGVAAACVGVGLGQAILVHVEV